MGTGSAVERLRFALAAGTTANAFWRTVRDENGHPIDLEVLECSEGFANWLGRPLADLPGRRYSELIPTGLHDRLPLYLASLRTGEPVVLMFDRVSPSGVPTTAEVRGVPIDRDDLFVALWDVTEREERLRSVERARADALADRELLATALNSSPDGFAVYRLVRDPESGEADFRVEFLNDTAAGPTGRPASEWMGSSIRAWFPEVESSGLLGVLLHAADEKTPRRVVVEMRSASGWSGRFENVVTPFGVDLLVVEWWAADAETPAGIEAPASVVTGLGHDPLTGLHNRGEFRRRLGEWLSGLPDGAPAGAVIVLDLDNFGRLNDLIGTQRADDALVAFARALRSVDPWLQMPARIGPDACAAVVPGNVGPTGIDLARAHAVRVQREVSAAVGLPALSISSGLRVIERGLTVDEILRDCDTALRHSVREGGARLTVFTPEIRADLLADYLVGEDILKGLDNGDFRVAYQPVVSVSTGAHVGDEALARWLHPVHGELSPSRFIPIAESTGTVVPLGSWIIGEAVRGLGRVPDDRSVGVNISGVQLLLSDLPTVVAEALERHRVAPGRLVVEITESAILPNSFRIRDQLEELRQMGVLVALDDFGSGYSSVGYLDWIPLDIVKLDRSFVLGDLDRRRRNLIAATAQLVRSIGARALVEGIETHEQWDVVREAGVEFAQGYLFGQPRPRE